MRSRTKHRRPRGLGRSRTGNILVLSALVMVMTMGFIAFAVEMGMLLVARGELQRAADAAALSASWDLIDQGALAGNSNSPSLKTTALNTAVEYAGYNSVLSNSVSLPTSDVEIGYMANPMDATSPLVLNSSNSPNAVRVRVRKSSVANDPVTFGFARVLGVFNKDVEATATAALQTNFGGFRAPGDGGNLGILPIALDVDTWNSLIAGNATDLYSWDEANQTVTSGSDGIKEVNLYPQGTGSPGNRGTVDIGSSNNSTATLSRQITDGITPADLEYHGGELKFDSCGKLYLNGDTGISAGIKDDLASIIGKPRIIPIFTQVAGPGNNATYTITKFVGIRILYVKLTGSMSSKKVIVQPATFVVRGGIPSTTTEKSYFMYSPARLIY